MPSLMTAGVSIKKTSNRFPLRNPRDVNVLKDGEEDDYESIGSGSDGELSSDDEAIVREPPPQMDELDEEDAPTMDAAFIASLGGTLAIETMDSDGLRAMVWTHTSSEFENEPARGSAPPPADVLPAYPPPYPGLVQDLATPSVMLRAMKDSPIDLMFYFLPKRLWIRITRETNRFKRQTIDQKALRDRARQTLSTRQRPLRTLREIRRRLRAEPDYSPREILCVMGLLVAHMLAPTRRFAQHWSMTDDGALAAGVFGRFMSRNRCTAILRDLHFANNSTPAPRDKLWKLRDVVDVLQDRFQSGWSVANILSFDEGVLPATSKRNTTRMFMPDKPHRYGTKMFMTCDSVTAYCHR